MRRVFRFLLCIVFLPVYCASFLVPRDGNLWVFGCWDGQKFADNPKYLFLYVKRRHPEIRPIWLTYRTEVVDTLAREGHEVYKALSIKGFLYSLNAGCVVISNCLGDVNGFAVGKAKIMQLWHGVSVKRTGYTAKSDSLPGYKHGSKLPTILLNLVNKVSPFTVSRYDALFAASQDSREKLCSTFREKRNRVHLTGYPRNDALFDTDWLASNRCDYLDSIKSEVSFKCVITYLPTHRQMGRKAVDLFARYGFETNATQQILKGLDAILIIKAHYFDKQFNITAQKGSSQRIYAPSDGELPDVYPLLKRTDILITDYSSVYFDYLLLNRPIIFTPFDIEDYTMEEGFYYDYNEVTPGPKAKDWPEVFRLIEGVIQSDRWKQEREAICNRFNEFDDNLNSERVFAAVKKILREANAKTS